MTTSAHRQVFDLPDLGEGLTEAELVSWLVAVGDTVAVDQPIAEVETAKSIVEVPCPYAGTVAVLHGAAGQTLDVGKPLISVDSAGAVAPAGADGVDGVDGAVAPAGATPDGSGDVDPAAHPAGETYRTEERAGAAVPEDGEESAGSGNVLIGYGTPGRQGGPQRSRARKASPTRPGTSSVQRPDADRAPTMARTPAQDRDTRPASSGAVLVVNPLVRKLARESGLRLDEIRGTGDGGMIMRADVHAAAAVAAETAGVPEVARTPETASAPEEAGAPEPDAKSGLGIRSRTPIKGLRKTVAANLVRSRTEIPEATVWVDVDATALLDLRASLKAANPATTPGLLAFIARFTTAGLARFPELNTRIQDDEIIGFDGVNLGVAAQTERGLMVPSVRRADAMSARELDAEIRRLTAVTREGKATPAELTSGTFTLNNYGVFGVDGSAAIINYPEVAILGVGRIMDRPWAVNGQLEVRKVTELTLTFDHRVCDGGTAGGFLRFVADAIENPGGILADL